MVWTADGRPHPAATRTLKFAADMAASRNNQQGSAACLLGRWRHEIQISILRRRAAMHRAVLPRPSAYEQWLLSGDADWTAPGWGRQAAIEEEVEEEEEAEGEENVDLAGDLLEGATMG